MLRSGHAQIDAPLEDADGQTIGRIPVEITYLLEDEQDYGADADGRRGVAVCWWEVIDRYIAPAAIRHLTFDQVRQVLASAEWQLGTSLRGRAW